MRTAVDFETLSAIATGFTQQSKSVLADALRCLRETRDPVTTLELLRELWRAAPGSGPQKDIEAVGDWLVDRLRWRKSSTPDDLLTELGWLYRLAVVHGKDRWDDRGRRGGADRRDRGRASRLPAFAAHIEALRRSPQRESARPALDLFAPRSAVARPSEQVPHLLLPDVLEVSFESPAAATEAFRNARERVKGGKAPKPRLLALQPVDAALRPLVGLITCSTTETVGMREVEQRMLEDSGKAPTFWIVVSKCDEKRLASQVHMVIPDVEHGRR